MGRGRSPTTARHIGQQIFGADSNSYTPGSEDIGKYLRVAVTYTDSLGGNKSADEDTDAVATAPPTNEHPEFASDAATTLSVAENTPASENIGDPYTATHSDNKGTLVYSLGGTDAASFDLDSETGQMKTKAALDYENGPTSYTVTVSITDGLDDYSHTDMVEDAAILVTINVTDVNEPPQFDPNAATTIEISEDAAPNANIGDQYEAIDPDFGDTVTYEVSGADATLFQVDPNGQLQVKEALDFDTKPTLTVIVSVTDGEDEAGNIEQTPVPDDTITVTITLTNVFEAPRFDDGSGTTTRSVLENTAADQPVGAPVSATDDENDTLIYRLGGTDATSFAIDTTTGQLKTNAVLDHETKDTYHVTVWVGDGKDVNGDADNPFQDDTQIDVTIEVEDVNEKPVFDATAPIEYDIAENTAADTDIGDALTATDEDENETLAYGLTGTDAASFDIDTATGQIKTKADLDHESDDSYTVTVTVSDGRNDAGDSEQTPATDVTIDVTITITDVDDPGTISLLPPQPSAGNEVTATLEDDDGIKTNVAVIWKWETSSDQSTWTVIDGATTNTYIPQDDDIDHYLRVTATYTDDVGPSKTAEATTDSKVLPIAATNALPAFDLDSATATRSVAENTPAGENIGDPFTATDDDTSDTLTYSLSGTDATSFTIVDTTGQIQTETVFDYDNDAKTSYSVTVSVHDSKDPWGNADTTADDDIDVTINVTDMEIPAIPGQPTVTATPGAAAGLTVTWTAIDPTETAPVDGYDVQYQVKDADPPAWSSANVTVSGARATITGLEYSTTYEVQVRSKNAEGESAWSPTGEGDIPQQLERVLLARQPHCQRGQQRHLHCYRLTRGRPSLGHSYFHVAWHRGIRRLLRERHAVVVRIGRYVQVLHGLDYQRL